jgi:hypothetical protein
MQNPDEPNLPFAQEMSITFRDMQNPDEPNLPFAQSSSLRRQEYYDYIVNGDHWTFGKMVNKKVRWTESNAQQYRNKGYSVVKVEGTGDILIPKPPKPTPDKPASSPHWTKTEIENIFIDYYGDDITRHDTQLTDMGTQMNINWDKGSKQRNRIEAKVNANKAEHQDFHDKLQSLGDSLALHSTHSIIPPIPPIIPTSVILVAVGIGGYFLMRRKRK